MKIGYNFKFHLHSLCLSIFVPTADVAIVAMTINVKNCSLYTLLTVTDQKQQH